MALDPSIFMQAAALKQQGDQRLLDTIQRAQDNAFRNQQFGLEKQKAAFDIDKLYETAVIKDSLGQPLSPIEKAGFDAKQRILSSEMGIDPVTQELYPKYQAFNLGQGGLNLSTLRGNAQPMGQPISGGLNNNPAAITAAIEGMYRGGNVAPVSDAPPIGSLPVKGLDLARVSESINFTPQNRRESAQLRDEQLKEQSAITSEARKRADVSQRPGEQLKTAGYANRMVNASNLMSQMGPRADRAKTGAAGFAESVLSAIPSAGITDKAGKGLVRFGANQEQKNYLNAAEEWVRAKLRKESGAVIGDQEMIDEYKTYFPVAGDGPKQIAQKEQLRRNAEETMINESAGTYQLQYPNQGSPVGSQGWSIRKK